MKYTIAVEETVTATFEVEANTREEAERNVEDAWMQQCTLGNLSPATLSCDRSVYEVE
jgi:hypothetical protein